MKLKLKTGGCCHLSNMDTGLFLYQNQLHILTKTANGGAWQVYNSDGNPMLISRDATVYPVEFVGDKMP